MTDNCGEEQGGVTTVAFPLFEAAARPEQAVVARERLRHGSKMVGFPVPAMPLSQKIISP
jgi:hypothetical protein